MSTVDWLFTGLLGLSMLTGLWRGLVREVLSVISWVAAFFLSQWFAPQASEFLPMTGASETIRYAAGFVAVFIACLVLGGLLGWLLQKVLSTVGLGLLDRMLGAVFGLVRGAVVVLAVTVVMQMTPLKSSPMWEASQGAVLAGKVLQGLKPMLPKEFGTYLP
jgi:membrane protein required for colicin V production